MTHKPITTKQFIAWAVLITVVFVLYVATEGKIPFLSLLPVAFFVIMPPETSKQPMTLRQALIVLGGVAAMAAFIWWTVTHHTPESDAWARSFGVFIRHPGVAVPLWLLFLYLGYRRWRAKPPLKEAALQEEAALQDQE
ncbi:MAG: hypothetical protein NTY98_04280 [Verrucomicrobia bacterium]|nr:hypothetical protein [Verrucomicrobiota bacterium]